jgi:hypothetical protein
VRLPAEGAAPSFTRTGGLRLRVNIKASRSAILMEALLGQELLNKDYETVSSIAFHRKRNSESQTRLSSEGKRR